MTSARRVMDALEKARPNSARFVGGCVRNALLGQPVADVDIATQLTPDRVAEAMRAANIAVHETGIEHGTLTVVADHHPFEVTTLRRDVETDGRRAVVAFTEDWAEDAQRRDFRMNALYVSRDGDVFDPTGGGLEDIAQRRIVFVGDPETRLREDYLRILRFFRFYAWYGRGAPDAAGLAACAKLKSGLSGISAERIWMETKKLLAAPDPMPGLQAMEQSGVFAQLFPEAKGLDLVRRVVA
ncbi:MAG TPA: CCA tRNA nucleotidyltransferase, partial [Hyphomonadaceae bacterium]|nr:CCA tRNA nucleotidyltransferase [Hyphomonadaceae bacterium]